jgi:hypothetical protein
MAWANLWQMIAMLSFPNENNNVQFERDISAMDHHPGTKISGK